MRDMTACTLRGTAPVPWPNHGIWGAFKKKIIPLSSKLFVLRLYQNNRFLKKKKKKRNMAKDVGAMMLFTFWMPRSWGTAGKLVVFAWDTGKAHKMLFFFVEFLMT